MKKSLLKERSFAFAIRIVRLYQYLRNEKQEYVLSKQILRSGTSIGANITEALYAQSRADFFAKLSISKKEAAETEYWLEVLLSTNYINQEQFHSISNDCFILIRMLIAACKKGFPAKNAKSF